MKIILNMAISANGMIATEEGSEDFLSQTNWLRFTLLAKQVGCFIWGRKTYETVINWGENYLSDLEGIKKVIISKSNISLKKSFLLAQSPEASLEMLKKNGFTEVIVAGGSTINSLFAQSGLIDEVIFDINPSILGSGIPVFKYSGFYLPLELISSKELNDGIIEVRYKVKKS